MRRNIWSRLAAAAVGGLMSHAPAVAGDCPNCYTAVPGSGHSSATKTRPISDRLYIHQFKGPTIAPGVCHGFFATKWTPWDASCPGGNCGPTGVPVPVTVLSTPPAADDTKPADPPAATTPPPPAAGNPPATPPAGTPPTPAPMTIPMAPKPIDLGQPKPVIPTPTPVTPTPTPVSPTPTPVTPGTTPKVPEVIMPKAVTPPDPLKVPVPVPIIPEKKGGDPGRAAMIQVPDTLTIPAAAVEPQLLAPPIILK